MTPERDRDTGPTNKPNDASIHDLVQEILDRPADDPRRLDLLRTVKHDDDALQELNATADSLERLNQPLEAPDLSGKILHAADQRRRFLPSRVRRWVDRGRLATAGALLVVFTALAIIDRVAPNALDLSPAPSPLSGLPTALQHDASQSAAFVRSGVQQAGRALAPIVAQPGWAEEGDEIPTAWVLEVVGADGSVYDTVMTFDPEARGIEALRIFRARRTEPSGTSLLSFPSEPAVIIEPETESLP